MKKYFKDLQTNSKGFSLMEIIIAMGVLMVLSSVGVIAVKGFDDRTKEAAAQRAAREVYNAARAKIEDGNSNTKPQDAANDYNSSQSDLASNKRITVKVLPANATNSNLYVEAYYGARIRVVYDPQNTQNGNSNPGDGSGTPVIPTIKDTVSQMTFQCDTEMVGYLPVFNISDNTTVSMIGSDGSEKLVDYEAPDLTKVRSTYSSAINFVEDTGFNNISEQLTMKAGVTYTVKVYGDFTNLSSINGHADSGSGEQLSFRECLVSLDKLGKDTGLMTINWIGGAKYMSTVDSIPPTVTNLDCALASARNINDENISEWDTSSVKSMYYTFLYTNKFNQDLNNWNTGNVERFSATFHQATAFNNGGNRLLWDTSSATTISSMFNYAISFDQNVSEYADPQTGQTYWDTSNVTSMSSTFKQASSFTNGAEGAVIGPNLLWRTDNVTNMSYMFDRAEEFNGGIYRQGIYWNTSKVSSFIQMFKDASKFNRGIGNWLTSSATSMSSMFEGASKFNYTLENWNTAKVNNMTAMFKNASSFNQNLKSWNVAKVTAANRTDFDTGSALQDDYKPIWS